MRLIPHCAMRTPAPPPRTSSAVCYRHRVANRHPLRIDARPGNLAPGPECRSEARDWTIDRTKSVAELAAGCRAGRLLDVVTDLGRALHSRRSEGGVVRSWIRQEQPPTTIRGSG